MTLSTAMVLAAGLGTRLKPLTEKTPKPLVDVGGMPVVLRALHALKKRGVTKVVMNTHYKAAMVEEMVQNHAPIGMDVHFSYEEELLETGGGLKKALPYLEEKPFFVVNADAVWLEDEYPLLENLAAGFDAQKMDALLTIVPYERTKAFRQQEGDFSCGKQGDLFWPANRKEADWVYAGIHVTHPDFIAASQGEKFSLAKPWEDAASAGRLHGYQYNAPWVDMGTHAGLLEARKLVDSTALKHGAVA